MRPLPIPSVMLLATLLAASAKAETVSYAIVIGNNQPPVQGAGEGLGPLRYADDDAARYYRFFSQFAADTSLLAVLDEQTQRRYPGLASKTEAPTLQNLRSIVEGYRRKIEAAKQRGDKPVLYLSFSGHGAITEQGEPFLAMTDGALTQAVLYDEVLARLPTTYSHLIVDACHAGGVVGVRGFFDKEANGQTVPVTASERLPIVESRRIARFPNVGVILATSIGEEAHEWSEIESGVFTHELLSGLVGPADVNGDLKIEYSEIQAFVASANRGIKNPRAIPRVVARPPTSNQNAYLVSLPSVRGARMLRGQASGLGHFYIELENGERYMDANVDDQMRVSILLPPSQTAFIRTSDLDATIPAGNLVAMHDLAFAAKAGATRGSLAASFHAALFASPYSRDYYEGYVDSVGVPAVRFSEPLSPTSPGPLRDTPASPSDDNAMAIGLLSVAGVSALASVTTGVLTYRAKQDYESTHLQRPAHDAKERYERYRNLSIVSGVAAVGAGVAGWWLWPTKTRVVPGVSTRGDVSIALEGTW